MDRFTIIGDVYAGSGDCGCGGAPNCDVSNCAGNCGACDPFGADCALNCSCNSACASNSGQNFISDCGFKVDFSCASNSNCMGSVGGCACNSAGGDCNSGSGGGSGNSGSGSCNSGG